MKINDYGQVSVNEAELFEAIYSGKEINFNEVELDSEQPVRQFNSAVETNADNIAFLRLLEGFVGDILEFDHINQSNWFMTKKYQEFPILDWIREQCKTQEEITRVEEEIVLFLQHNMVDLLRYLKYLVDTMRENNVVWGVGRGSSVASYVLYIIGVHKIDSIKYNLDIKEFLK